MDQTNQMACYPHRHNVEEKCSILFGQEDWSFAHLTSAHTLWGPHGYHRYPAKFIPQLVRRIIELYSRQGELVGDPFLGSATTGIEALRAGRYFYGSDINPIALLISRVKCTPINPDLLLATWTNLDSQLNGVPRIGRRTLTNEEETYARSIDIARATAEDRLAYWFPSAYRTVLKIILFSIRDSILEEHIREFFFCAFSNILRNCSIWLSGSTKPQKDFQKKLGDPVEEFRKQIHSMLKRNRLYWEDLQNASLRPEKVTQRWTITASDVRALSLADGTLDLLVTSPPYATCYEYGEMHQLTQLWFDKYKVFSMKYLECSYIGTKHVKPIATVIKSSIPSTGSPSADKALWKLQQLADTTMGSDIKREMRALYYYFHDMNAALHECARVVARGKRLVLIIGDSYRKGIPIPTSDALCEMAASAGFELNEKIVRSIPRRVLVSTRDRKTGRFSTTVQSDIQVYPEENILIFRRCT